MEKKNNYSIAFHELTGMSKEMRDFAGIKDEPKEEYHQVGGDHYEKMEFQPVDYIVANNIGFCEGNIIKYVSRWQDKGGVEDLKKARHYIDILIKAHE